MSLFIGHHRTNMHDFDSAVAHAGWASIFGFGSISSAIVAEVVGFGVVDATTFRTMVGLAASFGSFCFGLASLIQAGLAVKRYLDDQAVKRRQRFERLYRVSSSSTTADPKLPPPGQD